MNSRKIALLLVLAGTVASLSTYLWGQMSTKDVQRIAQTLRPYQVLSGQVSTTDFEVIYVLDNESKRLAVLKYDLGKKMLTPMVGRALATDFGGDDSGGYSMVTAQVTGQRGLLYVTDFAGHKAICYEVDAAAGTITPQTPVDLKKLFND